MPSHVIPRRYLTWEEVKNQLNCDTNSLRELIITKVLVPSLFINAKLVKGQWDDDVNHETGLVVPVFRADAMFSGTQRVRQHLFLRQPFETGALACSFYAFCDSATALPRQSEAQWFEPHCLVTLDDVQEKGVFMVAEVERLLTLTVKRESEEERQRRRFDLYVEMGATRVPKKGGGWKQLGPRGALKRLAELEKAAGRPYSDQRDVGRDLDAEAQRRRGGAWARP